MSKFVCRGPYTVRGYYNAPDKDRAAFTNDGYYRMGDMVRRAGGDLYVEGRLKDIINRGGEKISCEEVENYILRAIPRLRMSASWRCRTRRSAKRPAPSSFPWQARRSDLDELKTFLLGCDIAKFKLPERLTVVNEFPISPAGKILRRELRHACRGYKTCMLEDILP